MLHMCVFPGFQNGSSEQSISVPMFLAYNDLSDRTVPSIFFPFLLALWADGKFEFAFD